MSSDIPKAPESDWPCASSVACGPCHRSCNLELSRRRGSVLRMQDAARSADFQAAYWDRIVELAQLMSDRDRRQATALAKRRIAKKIKRAKRGSDHLTLEEIDAIAKRFALWTVRRKFDWPNRMFRRQATAVQRNLHDALTSGIWKLDIGLRREIEDSLVSGDRTLARNCGTGLNPKPGRSRLRFRWQSAWMAA